MNNDPEFAEFILKQDGMDKFFVKAIDPHDPQGQEKYFGTIFYYELYFNDIDNIWLICEACNLQKSDEDTLLWLKEQWLYGQEFLDYLASMRVTDDAILTKVNNKEGLAKVAIEWFWKRHANYISTTKRLQSTVHVPLQILNHQIDHVIGTGNSKRATRLEATLDFRLRLIEEIVQLKKIGLRPEYDEDVETDSHSSDKMSSLEDSQGLKLSPLSTAEYHEVAIKATSNLGKNLRADLHSYGVALKRAKRKDPLLSVAASSATRPSDIQEAQNDVNEVDVADTAEFEPLNEPIDEQGAISTSNRFSVKKGD